MPWILLSGTPRCRSQYARYLMLSNRYDLVIDASDNVATRYLVNDACVLAKIPLISVSAIQLQAQVRRPLSRR